MQAGRVCNIHASLPAVVLEGTLQGYCERCGAFHELRCFDTIDTSIDSTQHCCSEELGARRAPEAPQVSPPALERWPEVAPGCLGARALSLWQPEGGLVAPAVALGGPPAGSAAAWLAQARALAEAGPPPYRPSGLRTASLSIKASSGAGVQARGPPPYRQV